MPDRSLCPYSPDELRRMQQTLRRRFEIGSDRNLIDIGFGIVRTADAWRPERGLCATFFVREKDPTLPEAEQIPGSVVVRLKRGRRFVAVDLPTDVIEAAPLEPTGLELDTYHETMTAGVLLAWENPQKGSTSWGLATAGHAFPPLESMTGVGRKTTIATTQTLFPGVIIARSSRAGRIDAAIVEVRRGDLEAAGLISSATATTRLVPRPLQQLAGDQNLLGRTLRVDGPRSFRVHAFLPSLRAPGIGTVDHVVSVFASQPATFQRGSSGAAWEISDQPACMQIAGRAPQFLQGFGQSLETMIAWAADELARRNLADPQTLRIAQVF